MKHNKILVVKFASAHPTYGFSSIKPGVANIKSIEFADEGILVERATGQLLWHPLSCITQLELEKVEAPASKKSSKE